MKSIFPRYLTTGALTLAAFVFAASCHRKDKDNTTTSEDNTYTTEHSVAEKSFDDVQTIADQAANISGGSLGYKTTELTAGSCATVTRSSDSIIIDFGSVNCMCHDGRNRRGKIIVTYTGRYADSGSVHTITFDNYYQNDNNVAGTKTVTNMGHNSAGLPYFDININGTVTLASGGVIRSTWMRERIWTSGSSTLTDYTDDQYTISGTGSMTRPSGAVVTVNIPTTTPLVVAYGCKWIEAGTIIYTLPSGLTRSINFGNTVTCDNSAVLTTPSGATYTITLP